MIVCKNLNVFMGNQCLVKDFSVEFGKNQFWAVLGNNGRGKSTLVHSFFGLHSNYDGEIFIKDKNLKSMSILAKAQSMALLNQGQEPHLDGTVEQMIGFGRYPWSQLKQLSKKDTELIDAALDFTQLKGLKNRWLHELSGGEQRRAELATVLAQDSEIFLLDEPTNHMDLSFKLKFVQKMQSLQAQKLIVMITHDLHFVQKYCSNVLFLGEEGEWLAGSVEDTFTESNIKHFLQINLKDVYQ